MRLSSPYNNTSNSVSAFLRRLFSALYLLYFSLGYIRQQSDRHTNSQKIQTGYWQTNRSLKVTNPAICHNAKLEVCLTALKSGWLINISDGDTSGTDPNFQFEVYLWHYWVATVCFFPPLWPVLCGNNAGLTSCRAGRICFVKKKKKKILPEVATPTLFENWGLIEHFPVFW